MSMEEFTALTESKNPADLLDRLNNIPMHIAHGRLDKAVPFESNPVLLIKAGAVIYEIKDGTHGTDDMRYYDFAPHAALAGRS